MDDTQEALVRLVQATQLVATRTSLVHAGAPSLLGQLLPTALQLWSQDRLPSKEKGPGQCSSHDTSSGRASIQCAARELSETAARLMAADASQQGVPTPSKAHPRRKKHEIEEDDSEGGDEEEPPIGPCTWEQSQRLMKQEWSQDARPSGSRGNQQGMSPSSSAVPSEGGSSEACSEQANSLADSLAASRLSSWDSDASMAEVGRSGSRGPKQQPEGLQRPAMHTADYLTIEEEEADDVEEQQGPCPGAAPDRAQAGAQQLGEGDGFDSQDSGEPRSPMSPAALQLLLLLRVLRNLCATGSDATQAMAEVGVPAQVAHLVSATIQTDGKGPCPGKAQLSKVAAQLLANMSANEGPALHAVWAACHHKTFADLAASSRDVHGPLCRALLHCCSASSAYASALCSAEGSVILCRLLAASLQDTEGEEGVMELGWLVGHLVYVRGLLPELFCALAQPVPDDAQAPPSADARPEQQGAAAAAAAGAESSAEAGSNKVRLDALQCVLLELLSEEMEHGSTRQQLKVLSQGAPAKAERSLRFLATTLRELAGALAHTAGGACLEASVLEAAFQVLKDLYALDDGGASLAAGKDLGSGLARTGLVHLLLSLLAALPPIQARTRSSSDAPSMPPPDALRRIRELPVVESVREAAAALPKCPPYLGYRTDIVAVLSHASYRRPGVQKEILALGGVPLMLSQCQVDDSSPMVREWAMWGLRNLCEGNEAVQQAILDLQPVAPVQSPELTQLGLQVQLDSSSGKFQVVKQQR